MLDHFGLSPDRILESGIAKFIKQHPEYRFLIEWGFYKMPDRRFDNPQGVKILSELRKLWPRLPEDNRSLYLETAEAIAEAEAAKGEWNPKAHRSRHKRLRKIVVKSGTACQGDLVRVSPALDGPARTNPDPRRKASFPLSPAADTLARRQDFPLIKR